jgi:hypothetical protein
MFAAYGPRHSRFPVVHALHLKTFRPQEFADQRAQLDVIVDY